MLILKNSSVVSFILPGSRPSCELFDQPFTPGNFCFLQIVQKMLFSYGDSEDTPTRYSTDRDVHAVPVFRGDCSSKVELNYSGTKEEFTCPAQSIPGNTCLNVISIDALHLSDFNSQNFGSFCTSSKVISTLCFSLFLGSLLSRMHFYLLEYFLSVM